LWYYIAEGHAESNYFMLSSAESVVTADMRDGVNALGLGWHHRPDTYDYQVSSSLWSTLLQRWCGRDSKSKKLPPFWFAALESLARSPAERVLLDRTAASTETR